MSPELARFDTQTLGWMVDHVLTYHYSDGTTSTKWDKSKDVTKQVLTGKRVLEGKSTDDRVPGAGQLSVGIAVKAATNGMEVLPEFEIQAEGTDQAKSCTPQAVTVSTKPRINVRLSQYTCGMNRQGYFDFDDGSVSRSNADGTTKGRQEGYALSLRLQNTSADKGLKGLELPKGDITFDLRLSTALAKPGDAEADVSNDADWSPLFWDYRENMGAGLNTKGKLGRNMAPYENIQSYACWNEFYNKGTNERSCHDGGSWSIVPDGSDKNLYHVKVSGYSFDQDDFSFPVTYPGNPANKVDATANIATFSACYVQTVAQYPRLVDQTYNLYIRSQVENMHANFPSAGNVTAQENPADDKASLTVPLYSPGWIDKYMYISSVPGGKTGNSPVWNSGDGYGPAGSKSRVQNMLCYSGDDPILAWNALMKFDDSLMELPESEPSLNVQQLTTSSGSSNGTLRTMFAAKPDGTGWASQAEMNSTPEEGLVFFDSLSDLRASGKTCVGVLTEVRGCKVYGGRDGVASTSFACHIRKDAPAGSVASVTNDLRAWKEDAQPMSWGDIAANPDGSHGTGSSGTSHDKYLDGYAKPSADIWHATYSPSAYKDGALVGGHSGGVRYGDSCLVIGAQNSIGINVADKSTLGSQKSIYDLDAGERTVKYSVTPAIAMASANSSALGTGATGDATVTVTLPNGVTYQEGSATRDPESVTINPDGTSTLMFLYEGVKAGEPMDTIELSCTIGAAGTDHDVRNNQQLTASAKITSTLDQRKVSKDFGTLAETTFSVVRLAAVAASKTVTPAQGNLGSEHTWTLNFGNSSQTEIYDTVLADVMPYTGDERGSSFSGNYLVRKVTLDLSRAPRLLARLGGTAPLSYTSDSQARSEGADAIVTKTSTSSFTSFGKPTVSDGKLSWTGLSLTQEQLRAWKLDLGTFYGNEYVSIKVDVSTSDANGKLMPDGSGNVQKSGDHYVNNFAEFADNQAAVVHSNVVTTEVESVDISVKKVWESDFGNEKYRPGSVTAKVSGSDGSSYDVVLDDGNGWSGTLYDLPRFATDGTKLEYSVSEPKVPAEYRSSVSGDESAGFTITNTFLYGDKIPVTGGNGWPFVALGVMLMGLGSAVVHVRRHHEVG